MQAQLMRIEGEGMDKRNRILSVTLVIQILLGLFLFWPRPSASSGGGRPLLAEVDVETISSVEIQDTDGDRILMSRLEGAWVLPEAGNYPCLSSRVTEFLQKLVSIDTSKLVTRTVDSHRRLQVAEDDFVRRIELTTESGEKFILFLGSSPTYRTVHVRLEGTAETYLTTELQAYEANTAASSWVDTNYLIIPQSEILAFTLQNDNGRFSFELDGEGNWTMLGLEEGETFDTNSLTSLIQQISSLTMVRPLGVEEDPAYGMDHPSAVISIQTEEKTFTLRVGAQDPIDNTYVVISSESPYYVSITEYTATSWTEKVRDDFLLVEPTPTPETSEEGS
jgi:hypothetical protein